MLMRTKLLKFELIIRTEKTEALMLSIIVSLLVIEKKVH